MNFKYIINIMGAPKAGKDTFINFLGNELANKYSISSVKTSSADIIKEILYKNFNIINKDKTEEYRNLVANIYDLINNYKNFKVLIKTYYLNLLKKHNCNEIIFTQIRKIEDFQELARIAKEYKCLNFIVKNSKAENEALIHSKNNADKAFNNISPETYIIPNNGTIGQLLDTANDTAKFLITQDNDSWNFI